MSNLNNGPARTAGNRLGNAVNNVGNAAQNVGNTARNRADNNVRRTNVNNTRGINTAERGRRNLTNNTGNLQRVNEQGRANAMNNLNNRAYDNQHNFENTVYRGQGVQNNTGLTTSTQTGRNMTDGDVYNPINRTGNVQNTNQNQNNTRAGRDGRVQTGYLTSDNYAFDGNQLAGTARTGQDVVGNMTGLNTNTTVRNTNGQAGRNAARSTSNENRSATGTTGAASTSRTARTTNAVRGVAYNSGSTMNTR
jgi:hypothetical protein